MKENSYEIGDKVYYDFKLQTVREMRYGRVETVSDGYFNCSGNNLTCFPNTPQIKFISEKFAKLSDSIYKLKCNSLNYPDISGFLIEQWEETCNNADSQFIVDAKLDEMETFIDLLIKKVEEVLKLEINGLKIFSR